MKNTGKKIFILGGVISVALAGILVFYPTIVAPPSDVPVNNLHKSSLETDLSAFSDFQNVAFNDSVYNTVIDKLCIYENEGFMTKEEIDFQTLALVHKYIPVFVKLSNDKFCNSVWVESDHKAILDRIKHLRTLTLDSGEAVAVTGSYDEDLRRIEEIISDYEDAKKIASSCYFESVDAAKSKIRAAERYRNTDPLYNCKKLTDELAQVKSKIGQSHYDKVMYMIEKIMGNYRNMTKEEFENLTDSVYGKIEEYVRNREVYGHGVENKKSLENKAGEFYNEAQEFYRKEINVDTNSQWTSMSSPNSSYRAYYSYSNYGVNNSDAIMFFTIKGYETFSFYIRSNGESSCDYVMVGLDSMPTDASNYGSTKNKANSGTTIYDYETVTLNNLDRSMTYKVYVVYRKDSSISEDPDTGYVLIPNSN